jgi:hypothetical protein
LIAHFSEGRLRESSGRFFRKLGFVGWTSEKTLRKASAAFAAVVSQPAGDGRFPDHHIPVRDSGRHSGESFIMLRINPLQPPRPHCPAAAAGRPERSPAGPGFIAPEDFDPTGIMTGVDPSESHYWWMPELYGPEGPQTRAATRPAQAANGSATRAPAAA